jgi:cell division septal protein FtsQ
METKQRRSPKTAKGSAAGASGGKRRAAPSRSDRIRKASAQNTQRQKRIERPVQSTPVRRPAPDVVYTPAKPFSKGKFLLHLVTVVAVVLALVSGISIFFKVKNISVSGADMYSAWQVREASGIEDGENLLAFSKAKASAKIEAELPYVESVQIGIKLPDTVNIRITEIAVVYSITDQNGNWWLITADGEIVEQVDLATAQEHTQILGVSVSMPQPNQMATAYEPPVLETSAVEGVTTPVVVKASEKLNAALNIVGYLEANSVFGEMATVDVSNIGSIELWYGEQYQIKLGDTTQLSYKVSTLVQAISQLQDYHTGVLDASFTLWQEEIGYTPFP